MVQSRRHSGAPRAPEEEKKDAEAKGEGDLPALQITGEREERLTRDFTSLHTVNFSTTKRETATRDRERERNNVAYLEFVCRRADFRPTLRPTKIFVGRGREEEGGLFCLSNFKSQ